MAQILSVCASSSAVCFHVLVFHVLIEVFPSSVQARQATFATSSPVFVSQILMEHSMGSSVQGPSRPPVAIMDMSGE
ncbi:uncharacterized protein HD556DRAFT_1387459, partial [Suillus plorans]